MEGSRGEHKHEGTALWLPVAFTSKQSGLYVAAQSGGFLCLPSAVWPFSFQPNLWVESQPLTRDAFHLSAHTDADFIYAA